MRKVAGCEPLAVHRVDAASGGVQARVKLSATHAGLLIETSRWSSVSAGSHCHTFWSDRML